MLKIITLVALVLASPFLFGLALNLLLLVVMSGISL